MVNSQLALICAALVTSSFVAAGPIQKRDAWLEVTSIKYKGSGCPQGTLIGTFNPDTSAFDVTIMDLKTELEKGKNGNHASCHIEVGLHTKASKQINVLNGDFHGHVYLEEKGMAALEKNTYSFAGNPGKAEMKWPFEGPVNKDTVFTNTLNTTLVSPCGGDFTLNIDTELVLARGSASPDADANVEVSKLTGSLGHTVVLEQKEC